MNSNYLLTENVYIDATTVNAVNDFLITKKIANKSEVTIDKYSRILKNFFLECKKPLCELEPDDVLNWLQTYHKDKKEKTINLLLSTLSTFFKFCYSEGYIDRVLIKNRWRPRPAKTITKYLDSEEFAKTKVSSDQLSLRDRALISFLFSSGCRRSEVSSLDIKDIDIKNRTAQVVGKGNKYRQVHFNEECAVILKEYLKTRPAGKNAFFINKFGKRLGPSGIYRATIKLGKLAGLPLTLNPHTCRHTFATNLLGKGAELLFISQELGHRNLNTTRKYAQVLPEHVISEYRRLME